MAFLLLTCLPAWGQAGNYPADAACADKSSTVEISECLQQQTTLFDKRLNAAYHALMEKQESAERKSALLRAERAWIAYRTANCGWYGAHEGTIRQILAASCMLNMTRERALELEQANKPE